METKARSNPRIRSGVVIGNKMDKTVVVETRVTMKHPQYKKYIQRRRRFKAHDPLNRCQMGDTVEIVESRPISKTKNWRVRKILRSGIAENTANTENVG